MNRSRTGRLLRSTFLMILISLLATGCENFTLIGSLNLGDDPFQLGTENPEIPPTTPQDGEAIVCWPSGKAAFDEIVRHGFTPRKWPETEMWFRRLEPVKNSLPVCE